MKCLTKNIVRHGVRWEKVFSIQAPCITVKNMFVPFGGNGMLILDTRLPGCWVRRILGDELSAVMEIDESSVNWLLSNTDSTVTEVGQWAGNAIPASLTSLPVSEVVSSIKMFDELREYAWG